jgi:opacity protein-like surface antigen
MLKPNSFILGLLASCVIVSGVSAQGQLGDRYFGGGVVYEKVRPDFSPSIDGWGAAAEINLPQAEPTTPFSVDTRLTAQFIRLTDSGYAFEELSFDGLVRAYQHVGQGFTPYVGLGLGWWRWEDSYDGDTERDHFFTLPAEIGLEYSMGPITLTPFYRYTWVLQSGSRDFWTLGASAAFRFYDGWAVAATVSHNDWGSGTESFKVVTGLQVAY